MRFAHIPGVIYPTQPPLQLCSHGKCKRLREPGRVLCAHHLELARVRNRRTYARRMEVVNVSP